MDTHNVLSVRSFLKKLYCLFIIALVLGLPVRVFALEGALPEDPISSVLTSDPDVSGKNEEGASSATASSPEESEVISKTYSDSSLETDSSASFFSTSISTLTTSDSVPSNIEYSPVTRGGLLKLNETSSSGAARYEIPLFIPPGRAGISPNLALQYNSQQGNDMLGVGWGLNLGYIQRSTKYGLDYTKDDYLWVQNDSSELVSKSVIWGADYFGVKREESFSRFFKDPLTSEWIVTDVDGIRYHYGSQAVSRQENSGNIFRWYLDRVIDTNGNYYTISYIKENGEVYPDIIQYTGHQALAPYHQVVFEYETRTDVVPNLMSNYQVVTGKRLSGIKSFAGALPAGRYEFHYITSLGSSRSLLNRIKTFGADDISSLPDVVVNWKHQTPQWSDMPGITPEYYNDIAAYPIFTGDFNGDGKTDFGRIIGYDVRFFLSDGTGNWTSGGSIQGIYDFCPSRCDLNQYPLQIGDFNGDGITDFGGVTPQGSVYFVADGQGNWFEIGSIPEFGANNFATPYPAFTGDFNGDGKTDVGRILFDGIAIYTAGANQDWVSLDTQGLYNIQGSVYPDNNSNPFFTGDFNGDGITDVARIAQLGSYFYLSDGQGGWQQINGIDEIGSGILPSNQQYPVYTGDFNGDGKTDVGRVLLSEVAFYLSNGTGEWHKLSGLQDLSAQFYTNNAQNPIFVSDFNNDHKTDFGRVIYDQVKYHLTSGDGHWTEFFQLNDLTPAYGYNDVASNPIFTGDFNGDGAGDFARYHPYEGVLIKLADGQNNDMISEIQEGYGSSIQFQYLPSTAYENKLLPFVMTTLASVSVNDGLGNVNTTEFEYAGGLYDKNNREFRGFEQVRVTRPDGRVEENLFYQDEYLSGKRKSLEILTPGVGAELLQKNSFQWNSSAINSVSQFIFLEQEQEEIYESGQITAFSQVDYEYDPTNGLLQKEIQSGTDAENLTTFYIYQNYDTWLWRLIKETLEGSITGKTRETDYEHELGSGNLLFKTRWLADDIDPLSDDTDPRWGYAYDQFGNLTTITDPKGNSTGFQYETTTETFPSQVTRPRTGTVDHITQYASFDYRFGAALSIFDENNAETIHQLDPFGRIISTTFPDGGEKTSEYHDFDFPSYLIERIKVTATENLESYEYYDGLKRKIQFVSFGENNKPVIQLLDYDVMGRLSLTKGPFFGVDQTWPQDPIGNYTWQETEFDYLDRPVKTRFPHQDYGIVETLMSYSGFAKTITDPDGGKKIERSDYLGRIVEVIEFADASDTQFSTQYQYNAAGDLTQIENHLGTVTTLIWDTLGRKSVTVDPDLGTQHFYYDTLGNLTSQIDAKSQTVQWVYDELGRVTQKKYTDTDLTDYTYDSATIAFGIGRPADIINNHSTIKFLAYDAMGRVLLQSKTIEDNPKTFTKHWQYDLSGKVENIIYPNGEEVHFNHFAGTDLLESVTDKLASPYATLSDYEPDGKIGRIVYGNGNITTRTYDSLSTRLFDIETSGSTGIIQKRSYAYTPAGDINEISDQVRGIIYTYQYDHLHRLLEESHTGPWPAVSYAYDALGRMQSRTVGTQQAVYRYTQGPLHGVDSVTVGGKVHHLTYDANGNLITGSDLTDGATTAARKLSYNRENKQTSVERMEGIKQTTTLFFYDGNGTRIKKTTLHEVLAPLSTIGTVTIIPADSASQNTYYIDTDFEEISDTETLYIFVGNLRIAKVTANDIHYYHKDHLGSSTHITDQTGTVIQGSVYMPYGLERESTGQSISPYKFTDQEQDKEIGLYNYNARLYDPAIGLFVSADSIIPDVYDPQSLNRFSYTKNNPVIYTDPSGHVTIGLGLQSSGGAMTKSGALASGLWAQVDTENMTLFDLVIDIMFKGIDVDYGTYGNGEIGTQAGNSFGGGIEFFASETDNWSGLLNGPYSNSGASAGIPNTAGLISAGLDFTFSLEDISLNSLTGTVSVGPPLSQVEFHTRIGTGTGKQIGTLHIPSINEILELIEKQVDEIFSTPDDSETMKEPEDTQ